MHKIDPIRPGRGGSGYAPRGTAVDIELAKLHEAAIVTVRDYGPGVPDEALTRIFDPFYRVDSDRNRASGGLGLGLAIARRSVQLHKGKLSAQNANPGLLVTMEFPIGPLDGNAPSPKLTPAATPVSAA